MSTQQPGKPVQIVEATYENVVAICPLCSTRNVYNRASDIGHFHVLAHHRVKCQSEPCSTEFSIGGDLINPAYEMLLLDSFDFLKEKRLMQAVLSATTAYELFFSHYIHVELIYRPARRDSSYVRDPIEWLNNTRLKLHNKLNPYTFGPMQCIFLRLAVDAKCFPTMAMAETYISQMPDKVGKVSEVLEQLKKDILALKDEPRRSLLRRVCNTDIANLRNKIVHKTAYRPSLEETRAVIEDAYATMVGMTELFDLGNENYHLNEPLDHLCSRSFNRCSRYGTERYLSQLRKRCIKM